METPRPLPRHLYSLDATRGIAALAVVFWHWQHFFIYGPDPAVFEPSRQPLYAIFKPLYNEGLLAVAMFFSLSGFVFFWLYAAKVQNRIVSARDFIALRFSRLYPLHFATLLAVAGGQHFMLAAYGSYFIYVENNWYHFLLQLVFMSSWGFERGRSFNGPIWSVSVEVFLYAFFFVICKINARRWWHMAAYAFLGLALMKLERTYWIGSGLVSFFAGGMAFAIYDFLRLRNPGRITISTLVLLTVALWFAIPYFKHYDFVHRVYMGTSWDGNLSTRGKPLTGQVLAGIAQLCYQAFLFPMTILTLALAETHRGTLGKRFAFLGHISYSSYLLHFPLQLAFMAVTLRLGMRASVFYSPALLILFFSILIPCSLVTYLCFERPAQAWLRGRLISHRFGTPGNP